MLRGGRGVEGQAPTKVHGSSTLLLSKKVLSIAVKHTDCTKESEISSKKQSGKEKKSKRCLEKKNGGGGKI